MTTPEIVNMEIARAGRTKYAAIAESELWSLVARLEAWCGALSRAGRGEQASEILAALKMITNSLRAIPPSGPRPWDNRRQEAAS